MKTTFGRLTVAGLALTLAIIGLLFFSSVDPILLEKSANGPSRSINQKLIATKARKKGFDEAHIQQLLENSTVTQYLQRQRNKQRLNDYFSRNTAASNQENEAIWQLIETIEADSGMMAFEALALKLKWLERNTADQQEFDEAAKGLINAYRLKSKKVQQAYDPYKDTPGFAEYKAEETKINAEVQQMNTFPEGKTKQQYLRERLQTAREKAYGS